MKKIGGQNISPQISWFDIPKHTKSFILVCYDIHPIANNWIHWIVVDIPKEQTSFNEGASGSIALPSKELTNSFGFAGWGGP